MKKMLCTLFFAAVITALLCGCAADSGNSQPIDASVFSDGQIQEIVLHGYPDVSVSVSEEHMAEMGEWLLSLRVGEKIAPDAPQTPGANSYQATVIYADGTSIRSGIDITEYEGALHEIHRPDLPACWFAIWESPAATLPEPVNEWTVTEGITLRLMNSEFPEGVERMTLIMENRTDQVMLYGNGWSFERYEEGEWVPLPNREDAAWTSEGYTLFDHKQDTFHVSTFVLAEPLTEGLYRVTGCTLRVAADDDNLSAGGSYTDYPAYQLEFTVKKNALPDRGYPPDESEPGGLPPKEDWEWYTPWEGLSWMEGSGESVWQFVQDESGLVAMLHRPDTPENEYLNEGDLLALHLFDRRTGELFAVCYPHTQDTLFVDQDNVTPEAGGGFHIEAEHHIYWAGQRDGEWVVERLCR